MLNAKVPVISGVGHETDVTICDLVADLRAPTPTAAAELVASGHQELIDRWSYLQEQLIFLMDTLISENELKLERLSPVNALLRYEERLKSTHRDVLYKTEKMASLIQSRLENSKHKWSQLEQKLFALGPQNVMNRGFSVLRTEDGKLIKSFDEVKPGDKLVALLQSGKLIVEVKETEKNW